MKVTIEKLKKAKQLYELKQYKEDLKMLYYGRKAGKK